MRQHVRCVPAPPRAAAAGGLVAARPPLTSLARRRRPPSSPRHSLRANSYNFHRSRGPIFVKWFEGGTTNVCHNALDRHVAAGHGGRVAFYWEGNDVGDAQVWTYGQLLELVCQIANGLKALGVGRGDDVTLYMPMVPQLPAAMLACARIGAVHSVVFAGAPGAALGPPGDASAPADRRTAPARRGERRRGAAWRRGGGRSFSFVRCPGCALRRLAAEPHICARPNPRPQTLSARAQASPPSRWPTGCWTPAPRWSSPPRRRRAPTSRCR